MPQFFAKEWWALLISVAFSTQGYATAYVTCQYDPFGRLTTQHTAGQLTMHREYDAFNGVATLSYAKNQHPLFTLTYDYNQQGQITQVVRTQGSAQVQWHYGYDPNHNLQTATCAGALCPVDAQGQQLTSQTYHFDALNNIQQVISNQTTTTYEYDPTLPTRLIRFTNSNPRYPSSPTLHYDPAGHVLNDGQQHVLTYTPLEQVRSVMSTTSTTPLVQYHYNGDNQQVSVAVPKHTPIYLLYGQDHLLTQQQGQEKTSYLYGVQRLGQQTDTHPPTWYLTNVQGSVLQTSQTTLSPAITYSPYGQESTSAAKAQMPHFGFDGQLTDGITGWQFLGQGYRAYNPELRRFLQQDSLSPFDKGGINGYLFANNDPINQFDPTGHISQGLVDMMIGIGLSIPLVLTSAATGDLALGIGGYMALRTLAKGLFVAGNTIPGAIASVNDFKAGDVQSGIGDMFVALSGLGGVVSAQPDLMDDLAKGSTIGKRLGNATKVEKTFYGALGVNQEAMKAARDTWVTYSSTASNVLMGIGAGLKTKYSHESTGLMMLSLGSAMTLGYGAGKFYGKLSSILANNSKSVLMDMTYGSIRTGLTGMIAGLSDTVIELTRHSITPTGVGKNWAVPFAMGAFSGMTQQGFSNSVTGYNAQFMTFATLRMFYLFVKPPFMGAVTSGTLNSFFS